MERLPSEDRTRSANGDLLTLVGQGAEQTQRMLRELLERQPDTEASA
jgi:hypothetical protein